MEGLFVVIFLVAIVIRTINKQKKSVKASQQKYRPEDFGVPAAPASDPAQTPQRQPVQQRMDLDAQAPHRHVEHVTTQAEGYAGEGDRETYNTREVSCETVGHTPSAPDVKLPEMTPENLVSAVIMSEILGKPKALRR